MKNRIMIAEEDASVRRMLARVLESADYAAVPASNADEALSRFEAESPDLVLLDLDLPEQSSWVVLTSLHQSQGSVPVIVLTGRSEQSEQVHRRGFAAVMEKPLD